MFELVILIAFKDTRWDIRRVTMEANETIDQILSTINTEENVYRSFFIRIESKEI